MTTSVATSLPWALAGCTYDADSGNDLRNSTVSAIFYDPGPSGTGGTVSVAGGVLGGAGLLVQASSGMSITVDPGHFVVPNTANPAAGAYVSTLVSTATLTVAAADPTNPRIDIVVAYVDDAGDSESAGYVEIFEGTAAASPSAPAAPANSTTLARISVPANATSITSGDITTTRVFTCAVGGVPVAVKGTLLGYEGQLAFDPDAGCFYHNINGGDNTPYPVQARLLPFAPVTAGLTGGAYTLTTSAEQIPGLTATVTCDGLTDLKVTYHVGGFTGISTEACVITVEVCIDGTVVDTTVTPELAASTSAQAGFTGIAYTGSATSNTPASGAHTVTVQAWSSAVSGSSPQVHAFSGVPASAWMRVEPVNL